MECPDYVEQYMWYILKVIMSITAIITLKSDAIGNGAFGHLRLKKSKKANCGQKSLETWNTLQKVFWRSSLAFWIGKPMKASFSKLLSTCRLFYHTIRHSLTKKTMQMMKIYIIHCLKLVLKLYLLFHSSARWFLPGQR